MGRLTAHCPRASLGWLHGKPAFSKAAASSLSAASRRALSLASDIAFMRSPLPSKQTVALATVFKLKNTGRGHRGYRGSCRVLSPFVDKLGADVEFEGKLTGGDKNRVHRCALVRVGTDQEQAYETTCRGFIRYLFATVGDFRAWLVFATCDYRKMR